MIRPIKNSKQYEDALSRIYELMQRDIKAASKESDELEILSILVKEYELKHFPIPKPNPIDAIRFRIDQMEMTERELSAILGHRSRKSEIFSGKRKLSLAMIRKLHDLLRIPADVLIQVY